MYKNYFESFWKQYQAEVPAAKRIYELFLDRGEEITILDHDHLALRTFNDPRVNINVISQPFVASGYTPNMTYDFPVKHLFARHFEPPHPNLPKVFISELLVEKFSPDFQSIVKNILNKIPKDLLNNPQKLFLSGTCWGELDYAIYEKLLKESQYAAWLYAFGFRANHFTFSVNRLKTFHSCEEINKFLKTKGFKINKENGEVKGTPAELLEQSSIMAETAKVKFKDGYHEIPSCYYEFAKRYPDKSGELYKGFIAASADKIFESTDRK